MKYISTRGQTEPVSFSQAVAHGLAPDGGLFLPEWLPDLSDCLAEWEGLSYVDLSLAFFRHFADDFEDETLRACIERAYEGFDHEKVAPLRKLEDTVFALELYYGPTLAFKDFAMQLLGEFYAEQIRRTGESITVLGATSGDTGAAAVHALNRREGVRVFILYPDGRVSPLQERQMTCAGGENVHALAIDGSFDDAQRALKALFQDDGFRDKHRLSAVNSINICRILAQCVYYFYAYFQLPEDRRKNVEFVVPTGNFGNVLAGWMARRMGLPAASFKVATNHNDILFRFFRTGEYQVGEVKPSHAPSMDIQIASNFERFLYYSTGEDPARVRAIMKQIRDEGRYEMEEFDPGCFRASRTTNEEIEQVMMSVYARFHYTVDPHTACGFMDIIRNPQFNIVDMNLKPEDLATKEGLEKLTSPPPDAVTSIVIATAHPAKFPEIVKRTIGRDVTAPALDALGEKEPRKETLPAEEAAIREFIDRH